MPLFSSALLHASSEATPQQPLLQHPEPSGHLLLQGEMVNYLLQRARRRSVGMRITDQGLVVTAPGWLPLSQVEAILQRKAAWIIGKLRAHHPTHPDRQQTVLQWQDGMLLPYLGGHIPLRLTVPDSARPRSSPAACLLPGAPPVLAVPMPVGSDPAWVRRSVQRWFREQALEHFTQRIACFAPILGVRCQSLQLSSARTRWGSASARGVIRLHWGLLHFAPELVDYVVVHELCHLREMNHSVRFWQLVESILPDYRRLRQQLKAVRLPVWQ